MKRQQDLFDDQWSPTKVGFWLMPHHFTALLDGMGADEAEALRYEYQLVLNGERDSLGRPCLCSKIEKFPAAVRGGMGGAHDSMGSIVGLVADLKRAADELPIRWKETQRIFVTQDRGDEWRTKMGLAITGRRYRADRDFMPDLGRAHAWAWIAYVLGWRGGARRWPRREPTQLHPQLTLEKAA